MQSADLALMKRFFQSLRDRSLWPDDPVYVPYFEEVPEHDPIAEMRTAIAWSDAASVNLLSGQRGTGKSTQLKRLKRLLEADGCVVFLCDMQDYLNMTAPVEISDFFMAVMGALGDAVKQVYRDDVIQSGFWERAIGFLTSEVKLDVSQIKIPMTDLRASLKNDPSFKKELQERSRGHVASLIGQAHEFSDEVVKAVRNLVGDSHRRVVLLLDSIEQIRGVGEEAQRVYNSVQNLFSAHAESLQLSLLHVVYTVPPYLQPLAPGLGRNFGSWVRALPSVHVRHRDGSRDEAGLRILTQMIESRCAEWRRIFTQGQVEEMAANTGGDLRDFFRLASLVLNLAAVSGGNDLPVSDRFIRNAENQLRREMLPIPKQDQAWLRRIGQSKRAELENVRELPDLARFFDSNLVQNYRNGDDWYDVHPLISNDLED